MTRAELEFYSHNVPAIRKALERIADALEKNNEIAHNVKHAFTGMDGTDIQDKYANKAVDRILEGSIDNQVNETFKAEEQEELDTHHDYLHQLVRDLSADAFKEFCNEHCLPINDGVAVSNYITDLDYDEVLGIIQEIEEANAHAIPDTSGAPYDDDYDLRCTAKMYTEELEAGINFRTKKECILDYVTNEFGSHGARYTDIIKFAYYLGDSNAPKFGYDNRGYYSMGISGRRPHLTTGGSDYLFKGINKEGNERYFALSFVESATDYWKYIS